MAVACSLPYSSHVSTMPMSYMQSINFNKLQLMQKTRDAQVFASYPYNVRRGWFIGIELVLDLTTWVHFLPVPLDSIV